MEHWDYLWLLPLGFAVGAFGTVIGAGGGFLLAPILLMLYPEASPETITSISLAAVCANATSGSVAYARMGRVDFRAGLVFALAAAPGAVLGAVTTTHMDRRTFDAIFGASFLALSAVVLLRCGASAGTEAVAPGQGHAGFPSQGPGGRWVLAVGGGLSSVVGYVSSFLGIGGGIVHVPVLAQWLGYPVHVATATSHFTLALMALTGTVAHVAAGSFSHGVRRAVILSLAVVVGAQLGARLSTRIHGQWLMRALAVSLVFVGLRVLLQAWGR